MLHDEYFIFLTAIIASRLTAVVAAFHIELLHLKPISNISSIEHMRTMSKADLHKRLGRASEIRLSVKGRKSGRDIPRPVWFVHEEVTTCFCFQFRALPASTRTFKRIKN
jgi:hypothetical protein